jgi:hypothetical protein
MKGGRIVTPGASCRHCEQILGFCSLKRRSQALQTTPCMVKMARGALNVLRSVLLARRHALGTLDRRLHTLGSRIKDAIALVRGLVSSRFDL